MAVSMNKSWVILFSLLAPLGATADNQWYVGGSAGQASTDVDSAELTARLQAQGLSGTATMGDTNRLGWRLFGGYEWNPYLALEGGYTNLGELEMNLSGTGPVTKEQLKAIRPASGAGIELALLGKYPVTPKLAGFARAGFFVWQADYDLGNGSTTNFSGDDLFFGLGTELTLNEQWSARLSWERYAVAHDDSDFIALGLTYRLPSGKAVADTGAPETPAQ